MIIVTGIIYPHLKIWNKFYLNFASKDIAFIFNDIMENPNLWTISESASYIEINKKNSTIKLSKKRIDIGIRDYYVSTNMLETNLIKNVIIFKKDKFKKTKGTK
jgi:hypothetical protein